MRFVGFTSNQNENQRVYQFFHLHMPNLKRKRVGTLDIYHSRAQHAGHSKTKLMYFECLLTKPLNQLIALIKKLNFTSYTLYVVVISTSSVVYFAHICEMHWIVPSSSPLNFRKRRNHLNGKYVAFHLLLKA